MVKTLDVAVFPDAHVFEDFLDLKYNPVIVNHLNDILFVFPECFFERIEITQPVEFKPFPSDLEQQVILHDGITDIAEFLLGRFTDNQVDLMVCSKIVFIQR